MGRSAIELGIVIQARMGSTRLPGKVLMPIGGIPLLGHIFRRIAMLEIPAYTVVATTCLKQDDQIVNYCRQAGVAYFRGSSGNVLERYVRCAETYGFEHIVRLTGDNPFIDIEELYGLIRLHFDKQADFTHSFKSLPVGVGAEIFTLDAIQRSLKHASFSYHFEHVDEYMLEHPESFVTEEYVAPLYKRFPEIRLTVDTLDDYKRACAIVETLGSDVSELKTERILSQCLRFV